MWDLKTKLALLGAIASISFMIWIALHKPYIKVDTNVIYNQLSNDNWGTSTDRDSIDEEYKVVLTKDSFTVTELVPGSVFFKHVVKDSTIKTISFALENGGYKSNEYWATLVNGGGRLNTSLDMPISWASVHGTSSIVRVVLRVDGWAWEDTYYFWPAKVNKQ